MKFVLHQYSDENICIELRKTRRAHQTTKEKLNSIQVEHDHYKEELNKIKSNKGSMSAPSSPMTGVSPTRIKELEEKVYSLQEELTSAFRAKVESAQALLDRENEVKRLNKQEQEQKVL